jgi:glycosyltransferase involved in cell wall biosynthesis
MQPSGVNGGLQTYIEWLMPWLVAHHRHEFSWLALGGPRNVSLVSSLLGVGDAVCVTAARDEVWRSGGHGPTIVASSMPLPLLAQKTGVKALYAPLGPLPWEEQSIPSITLVADMLHRELPETLKPEIVAHRELYLAPTIRNATLIQCISRSAEDRLHHHYPGTRGRTFVTYLPIQSRLLQTSAMKSNPAVPACRYFFYPANFWPHKNHRLLIRAFHEYVLNAGETAWDLVLCGSDYDGNMQNIRELTGSLDLGKKVHLPGYVDDVTLTELWRQASALIFPSLHEGFGIPLLEAMAVGIPVLSADAYSLPEVAGDAAIYLDPRDPAQMAARMLEFAANQDLRETLIQKGHARLSAFDPAAETVKLVEAFRSLLSVKRKTLPSIA